MNEKPALLETRLRAELDRFTRAELQVVNALLKDYPMAGLGSVSDLASVCGVSTPTVVRLAQKLGFDGFADMQRALRAELAAQFRAPLDKHVPWRSDAAETHILNRFAEAVAANVHHTLRRLDPATFDAVAALLGDVERPVYVAGGRITRSIADYLFNHLQIIRPAVTHFSGSPNVWPQHLIDIDARCVVVLFDIRRYESDLLKLARLARERGARIVLFTDQWGSPVAAESDFTIHALVEAPSSWDSTVAILMIVETLIAAVQQRLGGKGTSRLEALESMFTQTRLFRDFS